MITLADLLALPLATCPDAEAIKTSARSTSFAEIERAATALAGSLVGRLGVRRGDRIIVLAEKRPSIVVTAYAIWKAGAIYVPVDAKSPALRLGHIVQSIRPRLIVAGQRALPGLESVLAGETVMTFEDIEAHKPDGNAATLPPIAGADAAIIIHTSGSTGMPKGAILSLHDSGNRHLFS